jgi:hypothetical protein
MEVFVEKVITKMGLSLVAFGIYGCGVIFSEPKGSLLLYKPVADESRLSSPNCLIQVVFTNQNARSEMQPEVRLLFFDKGGK